MSLEGAWPQTHGLQDRGRRHGSQSRGTVLTVTGHGLNSDGARGWGIESGDPEAVTRLVA